MKTRATRWMVVALWSVGFVMSPAVQAEGMVPRTLDVSLQAGGVLTGQVVTASGNLQQSVPVTLLSGGKEIAKTQTDKAGNFQVAGLKGGVVEVAAAGTHGTCRLWSQGTAPPAAQQGLLVVAPQDIVLGQCCGEGVGCGSGIAGGGGLLGFVADHPLLTAGVIGAAIAIPLALDDDDDDHPATP